MVPRCRADEFGGPLAPGEAGAFVVVGVLIPTVPADEEAGEDGGVGGGGAEAVQQPQVRALRGDDLGQFVKAGIGLVDDIGWADPGTDVEAVREQLPDRAARVPGGAAGTSVLRFVTEGLPVGFWSAEYGTNCRVRLNLASDQAGDQPPAR